MCLNYFKLGRYIKMIFFIYGYLFAGLPIFVCETFTFTVFLIIVIVGVKRGLTFIVVFALWFRAHLKQEM